MKGVKSFHSALAKLVGTKLATGITVTVITAVSAVGIGVIGYSGHLIGNYIEEHRLQQEEPESVLTYDSETAEETRPELTEKTDLPVQDPVENAAEEKEEADHKSIAAPNQRLAEQVSPITRDVVTEPVANLPVIEEAQQQSEPLTTAQQQDTNTENVKKSSSGKKSSGSGSKNDGNNSESFDPAEEVQFLNHKVKGLVEPMTFAVDTEAYQRLYDDSDIYDRMLTKPYTVMVYLCGTDLERGESEEGTRDIMQMLSQKYDMDRVNVLLCAGGTSDWKNTYMGKAGDDGCNNDDVRCNIYYLNPASEQLDKIDSDKRHDFGKDVEEEATKNLALNEDTLRLLVSLDPTDMGEDELLAGFINFAADYFPAEHYGAILWNHGGGLNTGVCSSDSNEEEGVTGSNITADELECALASSTLGKNNEKLGFIGFEACMMGNTELAYNLSPYCEYMIGSMEYTSSGWNYGDIFQYISEQEERDTLNKDIALKIAEEYYATHSANYDNVASIACYDLNTIRTTVDQINKVSDAILELYNREIYPQHPELASECYRILKQAKLHSYENGTDAGWTTFQYVDQNSFFTYLKNAFGELETVYADQKEEGDVGEEEAEELERLAEHLKNLQTDIDEILKNEALLFAGAHYYGQEVFQKTETDTDITYSDFWKELKGEAIAGTNIYMPYDMYAGDKMGTYREMNLMDGYTRLLNQYMEQAGSSEEKERKKELRKEMNYADMFEAPVLKKTAQGNVSYLQVQIKPEYEEGKKPEHGEDPYTDFMDTLSTMKVYISNYQKLSDEKYIDMVIADADIKFSSLTGVNKQINVVLDSMENAVGYLAKGELWQDVQDTAKTVYDWARLSYLENADNSDQKSARIKSLFGNDDEEIDAAEWKTISGMTYAKKEAGELEDGKDAVLYFKKVYGEGGDAYHYEYQGASIEIAETYSRAESEDAISFYHYYISEEGKEEAFDEIDVILDTKSSEAICLYEKDLLSDEMSPYNNYTVGVNFIGSTTYVIPPEDAHSDQYSDNPYLVGDEAEDDADADADDEDADADDEDADDEDADEDADDEDADDEDADADDEDADEDADDEDADADDEDADDENADDEDPDDDAEDEGDANKGAASRNNEIKAVVSYADQFSVEEEPVTGSEATKEDGPSEEADGAGDSGEVKGETESGSSSGENTGSDSSAESGTTAGDTTSEGKNSESAPSSSGDTSHQESASGENSSKKEEDDDSSHSEESSE